MRDQEKCVHTELGDSCERGRTPKAVGEESRSVGNHLDDLASNPKEPSKGKGRYIYDD